MTTSGSNDYATFRRALRRAAPGLQRPLPWIRHPDPWAILVSEIMLQQTQTSRVVEPWSLFLQRFPTPGACADAPLSSVLTLWGGLGFPRRAKALHTTARMIRDDFDGVVPSDVRSLRSLAGVGEYTANAVASFAFGQRVAVLDTNVGRIVS
ncbi:MAG: A/G-specific adenine glycosylase, partial [Acidobacteria bacterium]|nr:A/G-specific adenine glycosylase [Acidobacteriota bacterium]